MEIEKTGNRAKSTGGVKTTANGGIRLSDGTILGKRDVERINYVYTEKGATQNALAENYNLPIEVVRKITKSKANRHPDFRK